MFGYPRRRSGGGGRLIIALIMAAVALVGYFGSSQLNPVTGETQHVDMSPQEEVAMGLQAAPEMAGVSIHAPARGATTVWFCETTKGGVSIHAPARGATSTI